MPINIPIRSIQSYGTIHTGTGLLLVIPFGLAFVKTVLESDQIGVSAVLLWGDGVGFGLLGSIPVLFWIARNVQKLLA